MRRLEVRLSEDAARDVDRIFRTILELSSSQLTAERYIARLLSSCRKIGDAPEGGRPQPDLRRGLRTWPFEKRVVIAYRIEEDRVLITNLFYGGRDIDAFYAGGRAVPEASP